jgi:glycosyltransferase involved in cell wall biosynthesis
MNNHVIENGLSVIIPCKNEEENISRCLDSILRQEFGKWGFEIIVVDNGSTDKTQEILEGYRDKITIFILKHVTISELRNHGASAAKFGWLAFIDGDVEVSRDWYQNFIRRLRLQEEEGNNLKNIITGSTVDIPESPTWIERAWFAQLHQRDKTRNTYLNSGHMIIHSQLFKRIGGFNPAYKTGEDEKICLDALKYGVRIIKDSSIRAVHYGYPKTIRQFFLRELWHGQAMKKNLLTPWKDRDLLLAIYDTFLLLIFLVAAIYFRNILWTSIFILFLMIFPLAMFAFQRSGTEIGECMKLTVLFFIYGWAKVSALTKIFFRGP